MLTFQQYNNSFRKQAALIPSQSLYFTCIQITGFWVKYGHFDRKETSDLFTSSHAINEDLKYGWNAFVNIEPEVFPIFHAKRHGVSE